MNLPGHWRSAALTAVAAAVLAAVAVDLTVLAGRAVMRPQLPGQILAPQGEACVVREDACALVRALRSLKADRFDVSAMMNPEVYQRVVELAYPDRIVGGAPVWVGLCRRAAAAARPPIRVPDVETPADRDADFCVVDRR